MAKGSKRLKRGLTEHEINKGLEELYARCGIGIGMAGVSTQLNSDEFDKKISDDAWKRCTKRIADAVSEVMRSDLCRDCKDKMADIVRDTAVYAFGDGVLYGRWHKEN